MVAAAAAARAWFAASGEHLLSHFGEFFLAQLAIFVGVEFQCAIGECLRIRRAEAAGAAAALAARTATARTSKSTAWASARAAETSATSAGRLVLDHFGQLVFRDYAVVVGIRACEQALHPLGNFVLA